jgi:peptidoglycan/LPS O-acetylase OafA/YrhL
MVATQPGETPVSATIRPMKQWANLDFLRSFAVLFVVVPHLLLYTNRAYLVGWAGLTGVCFFFVHTSLVLMWSLERDSHVGRFYVRRAFRIYPLWIAVFLLVVLVRIPISPPFAPTFGFHLPQKREWLAELFLAFNFRFGPNVVGASWTLPLEVDMYLLLPYLFFFVRGVRRLWPLLVLDGFIIAWDIFQYPATDSTLPVCVPYFIGGVIAYQVSQKVRATLPAWAFPVFLFALAAIGYRFGGYRSNWVLALVLGLTLPHFRQMTWKPLLRCSHLVARYSYGIYLCHFIAIATGYYYLRGHGSAVKFGAFFATLVVLPVLFYHLLEEPMIRLGTKLAKQIEPGKSLPVNEQALNLEPAP